MERAQGFASLLKDLDQASIDNLVAVALQLPGPPPKDDESLAGEMATMALNDFGKSLRSDPRFEESWHSLYLSELQRDLDGRDLGPIRERRGARVQLLDRLGPQLSKTGLDNAITVVAALPPVERGDGISALLPNASAAAVEQLISMLLALPSSFGRLWALFNSQDALRERGDARIRSCAYRTAKSFENPTNVATALLLLSGYAGPERHVWIDEAAELSDRLELLPRLQLLTVVAHIARGDEALTEIFWSKVCALPTLESIFSGLLAAARLGLTPCQLSARQEGILRQAMSHRLRSAARQGRAGLLTTLAGEAAAFTALSAPADHLETARSIHEVCSTWHWPAPL